MYFVIYIWTVSIIYSCGVFWDKQKNHSPSIGKIQNTKSLCTHKRYVSNLFYSVIWTVYSLFFVHVWQCLLYKLIIICFATLNKKRQLAHLNIHMSVNLNDRKKIQSSSIIYVEVCLFLVETPHTDVGRAPYCMSCYVLSKYNRAKHYINPKTKKNHKSNFELLRIYCTKTQKNNIHEKWIISFYFNLDIVYWINLSLGFVLVHFKKFLSCQRRLFSETQHKSSKEIMSYFLTKKK